LFMLELATIKNVEFKLRTCVYMLFIKQCCDFILISQQ